VCYSRQRLVQKFYFGEYVASDLSQTPVGAVAAFFRHSQDHTYYVLIQNGQRVSGHGPIPGAPISVQVLHATTPSSFTPGYGIPCLAGATCLAFDPDRLLSGQLRLFSSLASAHSLIFNVASGLAKDRNSGVAT
jgi:hypothetical protein